jgi:hypothetical protein
MSQMKERLLLKQESEEPDDKVEALFCLLRSAPPSPWLDLVQDCFCSIISEGEFHSKNAKEWRDMAAKLNEENKTLALELEESLRIIRSLTK